MLDTAHTALTLMRGALNTGIRPGIVDADLGYFGNRRFDKLYRPTFDLGFAPCTDYRQEQLGASMLEDGVMWVEGSAYCPLMPRELITATADIDEGTIDMETYRARIEARTKFKLRTIGKPRKDGGVRMICDSNWRHEAAGTDRLTPTSSVGGQQRDSDRCPCTRKSVSVRADDVMRRQAFTYGGSKWLEFHLRSRATAESVTARLEPSSAAHSQVISGFAATQVILTISLTTYNLRETARFIQESRDA